MTEPAHPPGAARTLPPADLIQRGAAWVVDAMLAGGAVLGGLAWFAVADLNRAPALRLLGAAYLPWAAWYLLTKDARPGGAGVGKAGFDLKVVDAATGAPCSRRRSAVRALVGAALWAVPVVEPVAVLLSRSRRGIADRAAGTMVVEDAAGARARRDRLQRWKVAVGLVAALGAVAGYAGVMITSPLPEARIHMARSELTRIRDSVEYFAERTGRLPASLRELWQQTYLRIKGPCALDPWGNCYLYEPSSPGADPAHFTVRSLGGDGAPGGDGEDADLVETGGPTDPLRPDPP